MAQIMIVEDNQGTNKAICEYLKTAGHTLFPALDGEEPCTKRFSRKGEH